MKIKNNLSRLSFIISTLSCLFLTNPASAGIKISAKNIQLKDVNALKEYASNQRSNVFNNLQVSYGSNQYYVNDLISSNWNSLSNHATSENGENIRQIRLPAETLPTQVTNAQLLGFIRDARNKAQANDDVYKQILDLIDNGTITTEAQVDSNWTTLLANYVNQRVLAPTNQQLAASIAAIPPQIQSDWNQSNSSALDFIKNKPAARIFNNNVARSLNTNYTISTTRDASVSYSINVSWTVAALLSGNATAFLEYSINSGSSWITVNQTGKTLALLTFAAADDLNLSGNIPANALVRIRTTSSNMTPAYTRGQEMLY